MGLDSGEPDLEDTEEAGEEELDACEEEDENEVERIDWSWLLRPRAVCACVTLRGLRTVACCVERGRGTSSMPPAPVRLVWRGGGARPLLSDWLRCAAGGRPADSSIGTPSGGRADCGCSCCEDDCSCDCCPRIALVLTVTCGARKLLRRLEGLQMTGSCADAAGAGEAPRPEVEPEPE